MPINLSLKAMTKQILLPTDFSRNAMNAIIYALKLYEHSACDFYVLNTFSIEPYTMEMTALRTMENAKEQSIKGLTSLLKRLQKITTNSKHNFHMVSDHGPLIDRMQSLIETYDIEMVVMGTKGDTDARTEIYGSQTVLAIEKIRTCPVLAIPAEAKSKGIKNIVFPTGYRTPYKRREFQYITDIAKRTNAKIHVLHVIEKAKPFTKEQLQRQKLLKNYFEDIDYRLHIETSNDVQLAIDAFIKEHDCDMVMFINKKHNFIRWLLSKPLVKHLAYYAKIPILALHDYRR